MKLRNTENVWVLGLFLGVTGLLAALILSLVSNWTEGPIKAARQRNQNKVLRQLNLPEFDNDMSAESISVSGKSGSRIKFMPARKNGTVVGYAATGSNKRGYAGEIELMVGFDANGKILVVQVVRHKETPGLGAEVCERKYQRTLENLSKPVPPGLPPNKLLDQFNSHDAATAGNWRVKKDGGDFEFKTGATVTSRAIVALVDEIAGAFAEARAQFAKGAAK